MDEEEHRGGRVLPDHGRSDSAQGVHQGLEDDQETTEEEVASSAQVRAGDISQQ